MEIKGDGVVVVEDHAVLELWVEVFIVRFLISPGWAIYQGSEAKTFTLENS